MLVDTIDFQYSHTMRMMTCYKCGIQYAVPKAWCYTKIDRDKPLYCPNGHEQCYGHASDYVDPKKLTEDNEQLKRSLAQAIHDADQAEARRLDGKQPVEIQLEEEPQLPKGTGDCRQFAKDGRYVCPVCQKAYKSAGAFANHMRALHKIEPSTMTPLAPQEGGAA